jgi:alpha-mannosidase
MNEKKVHLVFDPSCEGLVWSEDGEPLMGITGGTGVDRRVDFLVTKAAKTNQTFRYWIEVAANGMFGAGTNTMIGPPDPNRSFTLKAAQLIVKHEVAYSVYWDLEVLLGFVKELPEQSQLGQDALYCANKIINTIIPYDEGSLEKAKAIGNDFFQVRKDIGYAGHFITAIGNCHIDTAWLWPYDETKRKIARSWSAQCQLIEEYPDYTFAASQMQQFEWLEELYPSLFKKIQSLSKKGNFIPIGGTWVEMDCNIPSGESFCRQFLYGQRYLQQKFGFQASVFWLPGRQ